MWVSEPIGKFSLPPGSISRRWIRDRPLELNGRSRICSGHTSVLISGFEGIHMARTEISLPVRENRDQSADEVYDDGHLRVEHQNYYVALDGRPLRLARTEFLIISRLARTPGRIVTAKELWSYAWGNDKPINSESLHVYIYRLRHKLAAYNLQIDTMVNVGYRLVLSSPIAE